MATAIIVDKKNGITKKIHKKDNFSVSFKPSKRFSTAESILPFRVKFTSIQVPAFSPITVPAIPLQIIGFSNYIL